MNLKLLIPTLFGFSSICSASELQIGLIGSYADGNKALEVEGYSLSNTAGGAGVEVSGSVLQGYVDLAGAIQYAASSNASAAFLGAVVSGPADMTTERFSLALYALPDAPITPYIALGRMSYDGTIDFTGLRGSATVSGNAEVGFSRKTKGLGVRYSPNKLTEVFAEVGSADWRLNSLANGNLGAINATTALSTNNQDDYVKFELSQSLGAPWSIAGDISEYNLSGDNVVKVRELTVGLRYEF